MCSVAKAILRLAALGILGLVPLTPLLYQYCANFCSNTVGQTMILRNSETGKILYESVDYTSLQTSCSLLAAYFVVCSISLFVSSLQECK